MFRHERLKCSGHLNCFFFNVNLDQTKDTFITIILTCTLSFTLLFGISASDLLVGLICQKCFVVYNIAEISENFNLYCTFRIAQTISSYITSGMSLATLSGISIDRLLARTLQLRYNTVVTVDRIVRTVSVL